jgi:hypothetical protein
MPHYLPPMLHMAASRYEQLMDCAVTRAASQAGGDGWARVMTAFGRSMHEYACRSRDDRSSFPFGRAVLRGQGALVQTAQSKQRRYVNVGRACWRTAHPGAFGGHWGFGGGTTSDAHGLQLLSPPPIPLARSAMPCACGRSQISEECSWPKL